MIFKVKVYRKCQNFLACGASKPLHFVAHGPNEGHWGLNRAEGARKNWGFWLFVKVFRALPQSSYDENPDYSAKLSIFCPHRIFGSTRITATNRVSGMAYWSSTFDFFVFDDLWWSHYTGKSMRKNCLTKKKHPRWRHQCWRGWSGDLGVFPWLLSVLYWSLGAWPPPPKIATKSGSAISLWQEVWVTNIHTKPDMSMRFGDGGEPSVFERIVSYLWSN